VTEAPDAVGAAVPDRDPDGAGDDDDEVEPVELLVQLAEDGEIEPWDIDIVAVTDAFLDRLEATDLRTSGRALFYASVLLRMKSDELVAPDEPADEAEEPEPWETAMGEQGRDGAPAPGPDPVAALDEELDRRLERKHARGSPETLDELVRELREAERGAWWKSSRTYDTDGASYTRGTQTLDYRTGDDRRAGGEPTAAEVTGATHGEDMEAATDEVRAALDEQYAAGRDEVLFAEVRDAGGAPVHTYLALLFLAHRGVVRLRQDDLFGDLWIAAADGDPDTDDADGDPDAVGDGTDPDAVGDSTASDAGGTDTTGDGDDADGGAEGEAPDTERPPAPDGGTPSG
jgi:segregation and condensation protein A